MQWNEATGAPSAEARDRRLEDVRRIAVLRGGGIGDLLLAVPAMRALAATYPQAEVVLLGSPVAAALLAGRRDAPDRVLVLPPAPGVGAPEAASGVETGRTAPGDAELVEAFLAERRAEAYDLAVQLHGGGRFSNPFALGLGARCTIGASTPDAARLDRSIDYVYYQHEALRWLEVVGLVGAAPAELEPRLDPSRGEIAFGESWRAGRGPMVVVHPGATDPRRRWPADRFAALVAELTRERVRFVLVGQGATEERACAEIIERAERAGAASWLMHDLSGALLLSELVGVLAAADVMIGNDSGPRHLAQAVGTATVAVYWFGNLVNAGPLGRGRHRVQISWTTHCPECGRDCTQVGWTSERCEHQVSFVGDVTVAAVAGDVRTLLAAAQSTDAGVVTRADAAAGRSAG